MSIEVRTNEKPVEVKAPITDAPKEAGDSNLSALAEKSAEQNEASDSETEATEVEAKEEEKTEGLSEGEEKTESPDDSKDAKETQAKKKGGFQRRIDKLNAQKAQAQQEADYWKREALKATGQGVDKPKAEIESSKQAPGKPSPDDFTTHVEYVEALTDWKVQETLKKRDAEAERSKLEQAHRAVTQSYTERLEAFKEKVEDFDEVLEDVQDIRPSQAITSLILESEIGPAIAYELAKNRGEFERINRLPTLAAAKEIGRIESRLTPAKASKENLTNKKITQAPRPIEPVSSGKGKVAKSISDSSLSQADYEKLRLEQMKRRRA